MIIIPLNDRLKATKYNPLFELYLFFINTKM